MSCFLTKRRHFSSYIREALSIWIQKGYRAKHRLLELCWAMRITFLGPPKNRSRIRVYHAGSKPGIGGPNVKLNRLNQYFPDERYDYNFVYSVSAHIPPEFCLRAKKKGVKIVCHLNSMFYPAYRPDYIEKNAPIAKVYSMADHVVYGSRFAKEASELYLGRSDKPSTRVYNAVDIKHFKPILQRDNDSFNVLAIGVHYIQHRLKPLIQAMPIVKKAYPNARLIIAGPLVEGTDIYDCGEETIQSIAKESSFSDIDYLGAYTQEDAPLIYSKASVMVHLKHMDWTPNTVIEAMACGLPVVHAGNGGLPELVGEAGLSLDMPFDWNTIHTPDLEWLAQRIIEAYGNRKRLGQIARQMAVERYDVKLWVETHQSIFKQLLDSSGEN